jgi:enterochelin esterase-like enzyme
MTAPRPGWFPTARRLRVVSVAVSLAWAAASEVASAKEIVVTFDAAAVQDAIDGNPLAGRLYAFLSQRSQGEPRFGPNWFQPEPFFALDVAGAQPGSTMRIDNSSDGFPNSLDDVAPGKYRLQVLLDHDIYHQHHSRGEGNLYSRVADVEITSDPAQSISIVIDQVVQSPESVTAPWIRTVSRKSKLLSDFHGREVVDTCTVVLPSGYDDEPARRYGVVYLIDGFGGSADGRGYGQPPAAAEGDVDFLRVLLSGDCKWGHHVYADSATNGPRGRALVEEMIPYIDATFRTVAEPTARFVGGHSSGGWSSLWLQITYPHVFGGVWSTSPDPVDFRDFQQVDLYADPPLSLYRDERGERRPIARAGGRPILWYEDFARMDDVIGRGGQLRSFEAVFSPLGDDGLPRRLWDRRTGRVDPEVAKSWEAYDIRLQLERNWESLAPLLEGKLHITTGSLDTFYLEGAVIKLAEVLKRLGSDAEIRVVEGKDHGSVLTPELMAEIRRQMSAAYRRHHE